MRAELDACILPDRGTIRDAMVALDRGARQIALAVDESGRLVGVATDGDLRRAILRGAALDDPVANVLTREFVKLAEGDSRAEVIELMSARRIAAIPVVDGAGRPVGLHLLHEFLEPVERHNWAVIMAGGQGMRLRPLTETTPKPMLRVAGRPILERLVLHLVGHGIKRIFLAVNYLGQVIEEHFGDGQQFGARIDYLREKEPLGTAGALALLPEGATLPVLVLNGDLVTSADLGRLLDFHDSGAYDATVGIHRYLHTVPFGCVEHSGGRVLSIVEKPTLSKEVNSGIYAVAPPALRLVKPGVPSSMPSLIEALLEGDRPVGAFRIDDDWIDVGYREQLARAREGG